MYVDLMNLIRLRKPCSKASAKVQICVAKALLIGIVSKFSLSPICKEGCWCLGVLFLFICARGKGIPFWEVSSKCMAH